MTVFLKYGCLQKTATIVLFPEQSAFNSEPMGSLCRDGYGFSQPKNILYVLASAVLVSVVDLGIHAFREEKQLNDGVQIDIGKNGVSVEGNGQPNGLSKQPQRRIRP